MHAATALGVTRRSQRGARRGRLPSACGSWRRSGREPSISQHRLGSASEWQRHWALPGAARAAGNTARAVAQRVPELAAERGEPSISQHRLDLRGGQPGAAEGLYTRGSGPRSLTQGSTAKCLSRPAPLRTLICAADSISRVWKQVSSMRECESSKLKRQTGLPSRCLTARSLEWNSTRQVGQCVVTRCHRTSRFWPCFLKAWAAAAPLDRKTMQQDAHGKRYARSRSGLLRPQT